MKKTEKLERKTIIQPAFDKRATDPKKNYGVGAVTIMMVVKGKEGAMSFLFSTGMFLPQVYEWWKSAGLNNESNRIPYMGYDISYHSRKPLYEGQKVHWPTRMVYPKGWDTMKHDIKALNAVRYRKIGKKPPKCEHLGVPCYCDGSTMRAEKFMTALVAEGGDAVWKMLEEDYHATFNS